MIGLECLVLGDSIAVGTHRVRTECVQLAKGGINSRQWNKEYGQSPLLEDATFKTVIISLGSNDTKNINTMEEIAEIRRRVQAKRVIWIMPAIKPQAQEAVNKVAWIHGDMVIPITKLEKDGVHPTGAGYREIAEKTK